MARIHVFIIAVLISCCTAQNLIDKDITHSGSAEATWSKFMARLTREIGQPAKRELNLPEELPTIDKQKDENIGNSTASQGSKASCTTTSSCTASETSSSTSSGSSSTSTGTSSSSSSSTSNTSSSSSSTGGTSSSSSSSSSSSG